MVPQQTLSAHSCIVKRYVHLIYNLEIQAKSNEFPVFKLHDILFQ